LDADQAVGDHRLGVGAGIDQIGQLEELAEADRFIAGMGHLVHGPPRVVVSAGVARRHGT
jgi:hypothetical protein